MSLCKLAKFNQLEILDRIDQTLMGCSYLNTHGISKRVIYSESVIKMLQHVLEKLNFSNSPFLVLHKLTELLTDCSYLNTHGISKRVIYSESVIKMLEHGIEKLNFSNGPFLGQYILTKLYRAAAPLI